MLFLQEYIFRFSLTLLLKHTHSEKSRLDFQLISVEFVAESNVDLLAKLARCARQLVEAFLIRTIFYELNECSFNCCYRSSIFITYIYKNIKNNILFIGSSDLLHLYTYQMMQMFIQNYIKYEN